MCFQAANFGLCEPITHWPTPCRDGVLDFLIIKEKQPQQSKGRLVRSLSKVRGRTCCHYRFVTGNVSLWPPVRVCFPCTTACVSGDPTTLLLFLRTLVHRTTPTSRWLVPSRYATAIPLLRSTRYIISGDAFFASCRSTNASARCLPGPRAGWAGLSYNKNCPAVICCMSACPSSVKAY